LFPKKLFDNLFDCAEKVVQNKEEEMMVWPIPSIHPVERERERERGKRGREGERERARARGRESERARERQRERGRRILADYADLEFFLMN